MPRFYFEDFSVGQILPLGQVTLDSAAIIEFVTRYDPQSFHIDEKAAQSSPFGGLIASGWHTCAVIMRLMCDAYLLESASIGSPGVEDIRWKKPVRAGDTLTVQVEILETRPSRSKPGQGSILTKVTAVNQHGEMAMTMESWCMLAARSAA